ncbi:glycosyltransferase family A protein [Pseudohoeflea coraliihabitans]|uniref:Glycosyltransferase family 2 protein n=1 Tax=Pseudohoeflea coraliihabitans TaxID=2860393 RepID=A0ABS6WLI5_9HYPH|nr:glycosyltransferase family A protein [Pseudohoeflea sp. DP4N28-3]MBW3096816.1 glycosyltransferase family 2 protein [Pseudohoeflea sp. DP4N28-3]
MNYTAVIPAYNASETIEECLGSIMAQSVLPQRIIVVDDGSTDATAKRAAGVSDLVEVIRQANGGVGKATTTGLAASRTELTATLDADDLWLRDKSERQITYLAAHPECDGVFGAMRTFGADARAGDEGPGWSRTTMMIRTAAALRVGPVIDPGGGRGDMIDWLARAREMGVQLAMMDTLLSLRRIRPGSLSYGRDAARDRGYAQVAWLALQRRKSRDKGS